MSDESENDDGLRLARLRHHAPGDYLLEILGEQTIDRLVAALDKGVPATSLGAMARWWQLESYLRQLVYIQLKALHGADWEAPLKQQPRYYQQTATASGYMASADDGHLLSHLGVSRLFDLIEDHWEQCEHGIGLPLPVWKGRVEELTPIRHRLAHCRRAHTDDARRIEQLLRDLEPGANRALRSYVDWRPVNRDIDDPVVEAWVRYGHPDAVLVEHGRNNKGINFHLEASHLPWSTVADGCIAGSPGFFWAMNVHLDRPHIHLEDYWEEQTVQNLLPLAGHLIRPDASQIVVTLPATLDPTVTADAIGAFFRSVFDATRYGEHTDRCVPRRLTTMGLDARADDGGILSVLSWLNESDAISIFSAS